MILIFKEREFVSKWTHGLPSFFETFVTEHEIHLIKLVVAASTRAATGHSWFIWGEWGEMGSPEGFSLTLKKFSCIVSEKCYLSQRWSLRSQEGDFWDAQKGISVTRSYVICWYGEFQMGNVQVVSAWIPSRRTLATQLKRSWRNILFILASHWW